MKNKTQLSVRPVRKSKKPGYPSWQAPNPLEQPYAQPYPFTQKAINWLAAGGLCGALLFVPEAEGGVAKQPDKMESVDRDTLGNPFPFNKMGLPHITSPYGTGLPNRLSAENARKMIDSLFAASGLKLEKKILEVGDGFLEVDGYDEAKKIGYVYLPLQRLDRDLYISWVDYDWEHRSSFNRVRYGDDIIEECGRSVPKIYERYEWKYKNRPDITGFLSQMKALIDRKEYEWKDEYRYMFYEFLLRDLMPLGDYSRIPHVLRQFYDSILVLPPGEARLKGLDQAMSVQGAFDLRYNWALDALLLAAKHENYRKRLSEFKTIQAAYIAFQQSHPEREEFLKKMIASEGTEWEDAVKASNRWLDELKASKEEIMAFENDAKTGKRYVAVISQNDNRCLYYYSNYSEEELRQRAFERFMAKNPSADSTDFHFEVDKTYGLIGNEVIQEEIVANLEKHVLDYIRWAKQQLGY